MVKMWKILPMLGCIFGMVGICSGLERPVGAQERPRIPPPLSARSEPPPKPDARIKKLEAMSERARKMSREADVLIYCSNPDQFEIEMPEPFRNTYFDEITLTQKIPFLTERKELLIVTFSKGMCVEENQLNQRKIMNRLEKQVLKSGFRKVVFLASHSIFVPILRETERKP